MKILQIRTAWLSCGLLFLLTPLTVKSDVFSIGPDRIEIPVPEEYCLMSMDNPSDARLLEYLKDVNKDINEVILLFADCRQLQDWRNGRLATLNNYGYVLSPTSYIDQKLEMSTDDLLDELQAVYTEQGIELLDRGIEHAKEALKRSFTQIKINETRNFGILQRDDVALYLGIMQNIQTEEGKSKNITGIFASTMVKEKVLFLYLWKEYTQEKDVFDVLESTTAWVTTVQSAN